ncbi:hypothetical protein MesoLjLc_73030 [Mesorhizobium sp. L-8-10]|uniref:ester cyclase n=1 Tax=unclassified Mesorhizobium TaxID=325217 RepID=UPI00192656FC|nr:MULTISPECIES: nuclear transport factor 2 family protein [unclassified Mesorhizobium]BCH27417.1 hypothetical protein MesoLjLb_72020 [Mesorhizobium sp. L-8-3]BCH35373.1 hypothetical protein MesoLjLc_73030 [Mesorhizobium sp. L-8-10]
MKRRQFFAVAALAGMAAALPLSSALADDTAQSVVEEYLAAWNAHDSARAAAFLADDVVYYDASVGKPIEGREAAKAGVIDNFLNAVPDAAWTMRGAPVIQGDRVSFEWEFAGTNTGAWADGTAATNKKFKLEGASMFTVKDGKITVQNDYYDALSFYKQLGLM